MNEKYRITVALQEYRKLLDVLSNMDIPVTEWITTPTVAVIAVSMNSLDAIQIKLSVRIVLIETFAEFLS